MKWVKITFKSGTVREFECNSIELYTSTDDGMEDGVQVRPSTLGELTGYNINHEGSNIPLLWINVRDVDMVTVSQSELVAPSLSTQEDPSQEETTSQ